MMDFPLKINHFFLISFLIVNRIWSLLKIKGGIIGLLLDKDL
jgi:hypothetical protein